MVGLLPLEWAGRTLLVGCLLRILQGGKQACQTLRTKPGHPYIAVSLRNNWSETNQPVPLRISAEHPIGVSLPHGRDVVARGQQASVQELRTEAFAPWTVMRLDPGDGMVFANGGVAIVMHHKSRMNVTIHRPK
jgi:hypothetical protein